MVEIMERLNKIIKCDWIEKIEKRTKEERELKN